ncbi:ATP-binding protein [Curtobacterium aetherium]|uniref:sensor histidine kinase n=1 Tax=Curtobacterium aetherium TaxID=2841594 RepID=UPI003B52E953
MPGRRATLTERVDGDGPGDAVLVVRRDPRRRPARTTPWGRVLVGVVLVALLGGAAVATVGTLVSERTAERLAVEEATDDTAAIARSVVEPALLDAVAHSGAPARDRREATARLDRAGRAVTAATDAVRVKLWSADGTVLWSDEPRLTGQRFGLSDEDREALETDRSDAEVSDLSAPENRYERGRGPLLEAYQAVHLPSGDPLLLEVYYPYDAVLASAASLRSAFAALAFGTVAVGIALLLPVVLWLLLRLRAGQRDRERLLVRALDAETAERRRLAADLHDGPVQDIAGLALTLGAAARSTTGSGAAVLEDSATTLRSAVSALRSSMSAIQPAAPDREGLAAALDDATARGRAAGLAVRVDVPATVAASPAALLAAVRFVREAVANTVRHAEAGAVEVVVHRDEDDLVVRVADDGVGFDAARVLAARRSGHLGTTLLRQVAEDAGGTLLLRTAPGAGTTWELSVPAGTGPQW